MRLTIGGGSSMQNFGLFFTTKNTKGTKRAKSMSALAFAGTLIEVRFQGKSYGWLFSVVQGREGPFSDTSDVEGVAERRTRGGKRSTFRLRTGR